MVTHRTRLSERQASAWRSLAFGLAALALFGLAACRGATPEAPPSGPLQQTPDGRPLQLVFQDEFETFRPYRNGQGVWRTVYKDGADPNPFGLRTLSTNNEQQLYVDPELAQTLRTVVSPEQATVFDPFRTANGTLEIVASPAPADLIGALGGYRYVSGLITTQPSFSQTYGYFEMRAKLPRGKGIWPAFWLLPADLSWPPEIDVMESIGDPANVWTTSHSNHAKVDGVKHQVAPDVFHTYAVSWDAHELIWFIDGREVSRQPTPPDMHKPMFMLANVAVGGNWPGSPDATTPFPARMTIDYIRAYKFP